MSPHKKTAQSDPLKNFSGRLGLTGVLAMGRVGPYTPRPLADDTIWFVTPAGGPVALAARNREQATRFSL